MYENLVYATPGLTAAQIPNYFKDASFGVPAGQVERTYSPRAGVTIVRDSSHGQAHVYGVTRSDTIFGAGYAGAEDRLFFMDVLRHAGRAQLSGFAGGANKAMDADVWSIAPYTEADLQEQVDKADDLYGAEGAQLQQDLERLRRGHQPVHLGGAHRSHEDAVRVRGDRQDRSRTGPARDVIATASLVGGIFGKGGGDELGAAVALEEAKDRFGGAAGEQAWQDFRRRDDPEAPTTVKSGNGSFDYPTSARHVRRRAARRGLARGPAEQRLGRASRRARRRAGRPRPARRHVERAAGLGRGVGDRASRSP